MNSNKYIVKELQSKDLDRWEDFIKQHSKSPIFYSSLWNDSFAHATNQNLKIVCCYSGERIVGGCCLRVRQSLEGRIAEVPFLTPYNGLIVELKALKYNYKSENDVKDISNGIIDYLEDNFDYVTIINSPGFLDIRPFIWRRWSTAVRYTYYRNKNDEIPLSRDIERRAAYAHDNGVFIEDSKDIKEFYILWKQMFSKKKICINLDEDKFLDFFKDLFAKSSIKLLLAKTRDNRVISGAILLIDDDRLFYWMAASNPQLLNTGGNQLIVKEILEKITPHYSITDFVGADIETIADYKSTFGVRLIPHYQISKAMSLRSKGVQSLKRVYRKFMYKDA